MIDQTQSPEVVTMTEVEATEIEVDAPSNGSRERTERSETSYPYFGLSHALAVLTAVRKAGGTDALSSDVMRELGIPKTTDRKWAYGVPAAVYFGLIERVGRGENGRIKATELGLRVALPGTPAEEQAAKIAAFKNPELYTKLLERFSGAPVPSREGLKNILHRDYKIVESMSQLAADAFLDSLTVAGLVTPNNYVSMTESAPVTDDKTPLPAGTKPLHVPAPQGKKAVYVPEDYIVYTCKLGKGRFIDIPLPPEFTTADVNRLHAFLQTQVDDPDDTKTIGTSE
jgi:hypothetical protein